MKPILGLVISVLFLILVAGCAQPPVQAPVGPETPAVDPTPTITEVPDTPTPSVEETPDLPVEETPVEPSPVPSTDYFTLPQVTYEGTYSGTLVDSSIQIDDAPMDQYFAGMNRNGVHAFIGFFEIPGKAEEGKLSNQDGLGFLVDAVQTHPQRVIPFLSLEWDNDAISLLPDGELLQFYRDAYFSATGIAGKGIVKGIGKLEQFDWPGDPVNGTKMKNLVEFAQDETIHIMFHPGKGETDDIEALVSAYPDVQFIMHQSYEDFSADREKLIAIMKENPNLYYSVDVDHLMYDAGKGSSILYEFETVPLAKGAERFLEEYEENHAKMLSNAIALYLPLIKAVPDQVMWGTHAGPEYNYDPDVYDRIIEFSRAFIAATPVEGQEKFAYQNAWNAFGPGSTIDHDVVVVDAAGWPTCTKSQENQCFNACTKNDEDVTPSDKACEQICQYDLQCTALDED